MREPNKIEIPLMEQATVIGHWDVTPTPDDDEVIVNGDATMAGIALGKNVRITFKGELKLEKPEVKQRQEEE
jgi:hypothetical protein